MNQQEKIEILAVKVMGWEVNGFNGDKGVFILKDDGDIIWNPYKSISDAMIILDKLNERYLYQIRNGIDGKYYITLQEKYVGYRDSYEDCVSIKESRSIQEAICEAALKTLE